MAGATNFDDLFNDIFGVSSVSMPVKRPNDTVRNRAANRQECERTSHKYQVHGKATPTKVVCARCEVFWAIGARTEPS